MSLHVIPVDPALTAEEAWEEIRLMGLRTTRTGPETWAVIDCGCDEPCDCVREAV